MKRDPKELLLLTIAAYFRLGADAMVEQLWAEYDSKYEYPKDVKDQWLFERLGYRVKVRAQ